MPKELDAPVLAVDIGGTSTKAGVLNRRGEIKLTGSIPSAPDVESYFAALTQLIVEARASSISALGQSPHQMGLAVAGFLDPERNFLSYNPNLPWLENFPLRERLAERFPDMTVELEIDSNAATMAEYKYGSGQGVRRFLCVTSGTGLGVGMTVDGEPLRFAHGCLGDIGHVIVQRDGPLCFCGGRGCAEIMVSASTVAERYRRAESLTRPVTLRDVIEAADAGSQTAMDILKETGEWLGLAISSMANILFPDHIAIAGGLSAGGRHVLQPAEQIFCESACILARSKTTFSRAALGPMATLIGAAWPFWS